MANLETDSSLFIKRTDTLQDYLHQHGLPLQLQERTRKYLDWLWAQRRGKNPDSIMTELPFSLRQEVSCLKRVKYVRKCPFFVDLPLNLIEAIALCFKSHLYSVGDMIVSAGDESYELFFVEKGSVEVVLSDGKTVCAKIDDGNFFGESALFEMGHRMANIRAADFCEILSLHKVDFGQIFKNHKEDKKGVLRVFNEQQERNLKRNRGVETELKNKMSAMLHMSLSTKQKRNTALSKQSEDAPVTSGTVKQQHPKLRHKLMRFLEKLFMMHSKMRITWELLGFSFLLYLIVVVPLRLGFKFTSEEIGGGNEGIGGGTGSGQDWMFVDYLIDLFFVLDVVARAMFMNNDVAAKSNLSDIEAEFKKKTQIAVSFEQIQKDGKKSLFECEVLSRKSYRGGVMFVDICASLPVDLMVGLGVLGVEWSWWLRLVHLVRAHRFFTYINTLER